MTIEERNYLYSEIDKFEGKLPLVVNLYCAEIDYLCCKLSLVNMLWDKVLCRKVLIKNEYGILGNLLYKYKDKLDSEVLLYLIDKDIENLELDSYCNYDIEEIKLNLEYCDNSFIWMNVDFNFIDFDDLSKNKRIVMQAVKQNGLSLEHVSDSFKDEKEVVIEAVKQNGLSLEYASNRLKNDKEVVMIAIRQNGLALDYTCDELKDDKEVVIEAVKQNGLSLEYASNRLKNDKELVIEAFRTNGSLIKYLFDFLIKDFDFLWDLLKNNENAFKYLTVNEYEVLKEKALEQIDNDSSLFYELIKYEYYYS